MDCRFWTHIVMAYAFTFWTCYVLMKEYEKVATMRLQFLASERRRPDQFTVKQITCLFQLVKIRKFFNWFHVFIIKLIMEFILYRSLLGMCHQILMNLLVSLWNTSFWSIIQITILLIR